MEEIGPHIIKLDEQRRVAWTLNGIWRRMALKCTPR
jgi:hypothetical protein